MSCRPSLVKIGFRSTVEMIIPFLSIVFLLPITGFTQSQDSENNRALMEGLQPESTIVFLGDSNTYAGHWVDLFDAWQRKTFPSLKINVLNLGLSSETACGLSEPTHPFPRPDVRTRLSSVLEKTKPAIVFMCYGMNDGIYHPYDDTRFQAFQSGVKQVAEEIRKSGAKIILLTPPVFDALPMRVSGKLVTKDSKVFSWEWVSDDYESVIEKYASWIEKQHQLADIVVDIHTPMKQRIIQERQSKPNFSFAGDGIHYDTAGHRLVAQIVIEKLGFGSPELEFTPEYLERVTARQRLLRDAYLTYCGHSRPGITAGKPIEQATFEAEQIEKELRK